ncbi:hypothetical protein Gohar_022155, partial [Gossypium harknessii]|nr:hypothetical protein [Gossypium harknessii]
MKAIGRVEDDSTYTDVMVPMAHSQRSPVFLLMGGGSQRYTQRADAFKETDVIYRALASRGHHHDMLQTAEL